MIGWWGFFFDGGGDLAKNKKKVLSGFAPPCGSLRLTLPRVALISSRHLPSLPAFKSLLAALQQLTCSVGLRAFACVEGRERHGNESDVSRASLGALRSPAALRGPSTFGSSSKCRAAVWRCVALSVVLNTFPAPAPPIGSFLRTTLRLCVYMRVLDSGLWYMNSPKFVFYF